MTEINATTVRLPPFSPNQPLTWFRRAERHFQLKNIKNEATKADYAMEVLPDSVFQRIAAWLDTQPAEILYKDLKSTLLRIYCPTPAVRARRIMDMPASLPPDITPTQAWHEINTLRTLPEVDDDGKHKLLDLAKEIWLMCLPCAVRGGLTDTDNSDIEELMAAAEQLHIAHQAATKPSSLPSPSVDITAIRERSAPSPKPSDSQRPRHQLGSHVTGPFICWYHRRFGNDALKCSPNCQFQPKNFTGGCA